MTIRERARRDWIEAAPIERVVAVLLGVIGMGIRFAHLRQPMRHDEAYTYLHYARAPLSVALSDYTYPNNHLFHTLLVWISTRVFGNSEVAIRLPARHRPARCSPDSCCSRRSSTRRRSAGAVAASSGRGAPTPCCSSR